MSRHAEAIRQMTTLALLPATDLAAIIFDAVERAGGRRPGGSSESWAAVAGVAATLLVSRDIVEALACPLLAADDALAVGASL